MKKEQIEAVIISAYVQGYRDAGRVITETADKKPRLPVRLTSRRL